MFILPALLSGIGGQCRPIGMLTGIPFAIKRIGVYDYNNIHDLSSWIDS
jgi:hypothetical protein